MMFALNGIVENECDESEYILPVSHYVQVQGTAAVVVEHMKYVPSILVQDTILIDRNR